MQKITLKEMFEDLTKRIVIRDNSIPNLYYKEDSRYHLIDSVNLFNDRITCEDGYWIYYDYLVQDEKENIYDLYIDD